MESSPNIGHCSAIGQRTTQGSRLVSIRPAVNAPKFLSGGCLQPFGLLRDSAWIPPGLSVPNGLNAFWVSGGL